MSSNHSSVNGNVFHNIMNRDYEVIFYHQQVVTSEGRILGGPAGKIAGLVEGANTSMRPIYEARTSGRILRMGKQSGTTPPVSRGNKVKV